MITNNLQLAQGLGLRWTLPCFVLLVACSGSAGDPGSHALDGAAVPTLSTGSGSSLGIPSAGVPQTGAPAAGTGASTDGVTGGAVVPPPTVPNGTSNVPMPAVDDGLPGRTLIRRLSNVEYAATIRSLFGVVEDYSASFPADTAVNGFTNNTDVQDVGPALAEQYMVAAESISAKAVENLEGLLGCDPNSGAACISSFIEGFGVKAWRRPLSDVEQSALLALYEGHADPADGVRLVLQAMLVSPSFLYRAEVGEPVPGQPYYALTSWEMASRLSYFLLGTTPDDELLEAAERDELKIASQVEAQARRLLSSEAAREQVADFFSGWLNLRALERLERDQTQFPDWDSQLPAMFHDETRAFATHVVFEGDGDLATLLTAPFTYGDSTLASYYAGVAGPSDGGWTRIDLPEAQRAGLLTQASFLATHAKEIQTDPVARGKFVRERILCQGVPAPPADLVISPPEITPGSTTRERFAQHEAEPSCAACHTLIDPIGLAFEHYDAIGKWRDREDGADIDARGELTQSDVTGGYDGVVEMAAKLAQSEMVSECFVRYWFRFAFGRGEGDSETPRMQTIAATFETNERRVRELLIALTQTPDFLYLAKDVQP